MDKRVGGGFDSCSMSINGLAVRYQGEPIMVKGEKWVTLVPDNDDDDDNRVWEFSLTSGKLLAIK